MCLNLTTLKVSKSTKPKVVYKILRKLGSELYCTPFTNIVVPLDTSIVPMGDPVITFDWGRKLVCIHGGVIHAFTTKEAASNFMLFSTRPENLVIVKAIIPENTPYFLGLNSQIGACRIFYKKEV